MSEYQPNRVRYIGLITFFLGVALLLLVFIWCYQIFTSAGELVGQPIVETASGAAGSHLQLSKLAADLKALEIVVIRFLALFLMSYSASLLAAKGIELYSASHQKRE